MFNMKRAGHCIVQAGEWQGVDVSWLVQSRVCCTIRAVSCHVFTRSRTSRWSCSMPKPTASSSEPTYCRSGRPGSTWRGWWRSYSSSSGPNPAVTRTGRPRTCQLRTSWVTHIPPQSFTPLLPWSPNILCPTQTREPSTQESWAGLIAPILITLAL